MRKQEILKQWKFIFQSSLIFYLGFTILGIIPLVTFEEVLWERNLFFIILGAVLGVVMFIGFIAMFLMILLSAWPKVRSFDYFYMGVLILSLFVVDVMMSDVGVFDQDTMMIVFLIVTFLVVLLQLIARVMIDRTKEVKLEDVWEEGMKKLPIVPLAYKTNITKMVMTVLVVLVFVTLNEFGQVSDQLVTIFVVFALGIYVLRLYHQTFAVEKKQKVFDYGFFLVSYTGMLVILYFFAAFFQMHSVLKALLVLLPFAPFLWVIIPSFYVIYWTEKHKNISKE